MELSFDTVDHGNGFDFGRAAADYAKYRDIYPASLYRKLEETGAVRAGLRVLDAGTGTGVLPRAMYGTGARFTGIDLSPEQIEAARALSAGKAIEYRVLRRIDAVPGPKLRYGDGLPVHPILRSGAFFRRARQNHGSRRTPRRGPHELAPARRPGRPDVGGSDPRMQPGPGTAAASAPPRSGNTVRQKSASPPGGLCWREALPFSIDSWAGRLRSCRGLGASLPPERVAAFERAAPDPAGRRSRRTVHGPALCRNRTSPAERRQGALTSAPACSSRTGPSTCRSSWLNGIEMPRSSKSSATFSRSVDSTMTCAPVRTQTRSVKSIALS